MQAVFKLRNGVRSLPPKERKWKSGHPTHYTHVKNTPVFLYIMYCKGYAKIGITENPKSRICSMQGGNPFPIEMIYSASLPKEMAVSAEHEVLLALNDVHWFGDWFKTSRSHAKFITASVVSRLQKAGSPEPQPMPDREILKLPGMKRKVVGPNGETFDSCAQAAAFVGVTRQAMHTRLMHGWKGWRWVEV